MNLINISEGTLNWGDGGGDLKVGFYGNIYPTDYTYNHVIQCSVVHVGMG